MQFYMQVNYKEISIEIPDEDWEEISLHVAPWSDPEDGYECMDNFRVCRIGNEEQEAMYEQKRTDGCCGSVDTNFTCSSGNQYQIGCNYGH